MKKALVLISLLLLTGCGEKIYTCNVKTSTFEQDWKYTSKKEEVKTIELNITYDNSMFENIDSFKELTPQEKRVLGDEILSKLGFQSRKNKGLNIDIIVDDKINVKAIIDTAEVDKESIKKIGLDLDKTGTNINDIIKNMKDNGATCK
jgi:hypothetical protein